MGIEIAGYAVGAEAGADLAHGVGDFCGVGEIGAQGDVFDFCAEREDERKEERRRRIRALEE